MIINVKRGCHPDQSKMRWYHAKSWSITRNHGSTNRLWEKSTRYRTRINRYTKESRVIHQHHPVQQAGARLRTKPDTHLHAKTLGQPSD
ncbi:hypothetical protein [Lentibacillus persicus]|uniref:hypothetical protein n=1 Tax=Lentibacillus persicus TaxID=640948 RepID=UPI0011604F46|nr:hypothetical protein [Lentibacillus persicus]